MLTLDGRGCNREGEGVAEEFHADALADDFDLRKDRRGHFSGLNDAEVVDIAILPQFPVLLIEIHTEHIFGREFRTVHAVGEANPEIERMVTDIFDGDALADDIARDDVNALTGEFGAVSGAFVDDELNAAGGYNIGGFADGGRAVPL